MSALILTKDAKTTRQLGGFWFEFGLVDLRGDLSLTRHSYGFTIPPTASSLSNHRYPDKAQLLEIILALRAEGQSYRAISHEVGLHWTRISQILKAVDSESGDEPA